MVFGTDNRCPVRYPLLFGVVSMLFYLAFNEASWLPDTVTAEMISLALISVGGIVGIVFLDLVIEAYDLDPPQTQLHRLIDRADDLVDWVLARL